MSMIKKILLTLTLIFVFTGSAFAYGSPRWFNVPISVYIPTANKSAAMANAFRAWQSATRGDVRFIIRTSKNMSSMCDISVAFVSNINNEKGYSVNFIYPTIRSGSANFYKARINISLKDSKGEDLSNSELYRRMVSAAGEAIGVQYYNNETRENSPLITQDDIAQVHALYRP